MSYGLLALKAEELNEYFDNVEKRDTVIKNETNKEQQQSLFSCVFCNKIYKWKKSLNHHIFTIHGNPELIECLICNLKKHHALSPIIKAEKILPQIFLDITHYSNFGQHILVSKKYFKAQFLKKI